MDTECVVFGCINSAISTKRKNDYKFFRFPLDRKELMDKWLAKLCLEGWHPGPENVVCADHFSPESFNNYEGNITLKPDAVPYFVGGLQQIVFETEQESYECVKNLDGKSSKYRCRICAKHLLYENAIHIHSDNENVVEKMMACIPVLLMKMEDDLPKYICHSCLVDLNISYRMLVRAIESQKFFYSLVCDSNCESNVIFENEKDTTKKQSDCVFVPNIDNSCDREKLVDEFIYENAFILNECTNMLIDSTNSLEAIRPVIDVDNVCDSVASSTVNNCMESLTPWICNICKVDLVSEEAVALHLELKHCATHLSHVSHPKKAEKLQSYKWTCKHCGKTLSSKMNLTIHERSHSGVRPFVCEHCGFTFKSNANLIQHRLVHSADKKFVCTICTKAFTRKEFLNTHKRVHTGERPYCCDICGNRYTQIGDMRRHKKKHES